MSGRFAWIPDLALTGRWEVASGNTQSAERISLFGVVLFRLACFVARVRRRLVITGKFDGVAAAEHKQGCYYCQGTVLHDIGVCAKIIRMCLKMKAWNN